jgi:hypothetical protein
LDPERADLAVMGVEAGRVAKEAAAGVAKGVGVMDADLQLIAIPVSLFLGGG